MTGLARTIVFLMMLVPFWSAVRLAGFTLFDAILPIAVATTWLARRSRTGLGDRDRVVLVVSQVLALMSVAPSALMTTDIGDHLQKWLIVQVAMIGMLVTLSMIRDRRLLSYDEIRVALCASGTMCSLFVILQGAFGLFRWISPQLDDTLAWGDELRPTGLAEHPIETGSIAAVSVILCASLLLRRGEGRNYRSLALLTAALAINVLSFAYSASLTALFGLAASLVVFLIVAGRTKTLTIGSAILLFIAVPLVLRSNSLLADRLNKLGSSGGDYVTVQTRRSQLSDTLARIDVPSAVLGHGYSVKDLPEGLEIHNALLASDYHFGILGMLSQLILLVFTLGKFRLNYSREMKATLAAVFIIFLSEYLTGPVFARRSNWIALLALAIYMPLVPKPSLRVPTFAFRAGRRPAMHT